MHPSISPFAMLDKPNSHCLTQSETMYGTPSNMILTDLCSRPNPILGRLVQQSDHKSVDYIRGKSFVTWNGLVDPK